MLCNQATKQPSNQATKQPTDFKVLLESIKHEIQKIRDYTPRVGVVGNSGVGKSSLCNALFGEDVANTSAVTACTRGAQEIIIGAKEGKGGMILVDLPGIGEDPDRQEEYIKLYQEQMPKLDLVLWAIKADDRNYDSALKGYNAVLKKSETPRIFVITQLNKLEPMDDWDSQSFSPTGEQFDNMQLKEHTVSKVFEIPVSNIISVAVNPRKKGVNYQLKELVERIVEVLPNQKKYAFTREASPENVTETARVSAEKGILDHVKEFAGDVWDTVKDSAVTALVTSAPRAISNFIKRLFW